jgi:hypothetical protein
MKTTRSFASNVLLLKCFIGCIILYMKAESCLSHHWFCPEGMGLFLFVLSTKRNKKINFAYSASRAKRAVK